MHKIIFFISLFFLILSCSSKQDDYNLYAQPDPVKISEQQQFFNIKKRNPENEVIPKNIHLKEQVFVSKIGNATTNLDWYFRGPSNIGGRTRALVLDVKNQDRFLVGGVSAGLWISDDLGVSFQKATTPQQLHSITCLAQDTRNGFENIWYYGTGEQNGNSADIIGNGIFKSTDNGLTWNLIASTANEAPNVISTLGDFRFIKDVKVSPINGNVVVASFTGIWTSTDGGDTWTNHLTGGANPNGFGYINFGKQTNIDVSPSGVFYATLSSDCIDEGIWRSEDGENWTEITPSGFSSAYRRVESGISESDENQVFFIVDISTTVPLADNHQLWKYNYNTSGGFWTNKTANIPDGVCTGFYDFDFGYFQSQNSYDLFISVHPEDTNTIFLGGTNLYRSTDGFSTPAHKWIGGYFCDPLDPGNYVFPNHHPDNHGAIVIPNTNIMISAHDGGLSKTMDCTAANIVWESINNGYNTSQFYTVAIEPGDSDNDIIMGGMQDNGTWMTNSINPNQDWMYTFYGDGAYIAIAEGRESYYISWQGGKTFKADIDDDGNVNTITRIDPTGADDYLFINPFILDATNSNTMYLAAGRYIWRNDSLNHIVNVQDEFVTDNTGWSRIDNSNVIPRISTLDMSEANSDIIYYATEGGRVYKMEGLDDESYSQTNLTDAIMPAGAYASCIEVDNQDENKVMVTFSNYEVESIFYSEDAGDTWEDVSGNLEEFENGSGAGPSVNWANIYFDGSKNIYFVGTTSGLFSTETLDGTNTIWLREGLNEIGYVPVNMITSRTFDNNIVIGTHGNGIYSSKEFISGISDLNIDDNGFYISNVYPNPSKGKLKFSYRIDKDANVKLMLYDNIGNLVEVIEDTKKRKGTYEKRWFAKANMSKGMYRLVLDANGKTLSKSFILE